MQIFEDEVAKIDAAAKAEKTAAAITRASLKKSLVAIGKRPKK
jgi:hypothetical protein